MTPESPATSPHAGLSFSASPASTRVFAKAVLMVTALVGTLDIIAAHLHIWAASGRFPATILKAIAGGALGRERAMQGGAGTMLLGLFFHFFISFSFTLLFFLVYPRWNVMQRNVAVTGVVYSLFVWFTMNFIVLPLSALPWSPPNFANKHTYIGICVLTAIFGLPIALGADRFCKKHAP